MIKKLLIFIVLCPMAVANAGSKDSNFNYSVNTNVEGMVNINGAMVAPMNNVNVDISVTGDQQGLDSEYTFSIKAEPIKKNRPYYKSIDQIHYAVAGLETVVRSGSNEELPWETTINAQGVATAHLTAAYSMSLNPVLNPKSAKLIKNTKIKIALLKDDKVVAGKNFLPSADSPTVEIQASFEMDKGKVKSQPAVSGSQINSKVEVNMGSVHSSEEVTYTLEVTAMPIKKKKPFLKKVDQIHYVLAGLSTSTGMEAEKTLPWKKTITGHGISSADLSILYITSLNDIVSPESARLAKNTRITLKIMRGDKVLASKKYRPSEDEPSAEIELDFDEK